MVKIAAIWIPSDQYGEASLVLGVVVLLNSLLIGPLMTAHMRVYFDYRERGLEHWFARLFAKICFVVAVICGGIYIVIAGGWWTFGSPQLIKMAFPAILLIILQAFMSLATNYLEAHRLYFKLALINTGLKLMQVPALLLLLAMPFSSASAVIGAQALAIVPLLFWSRGIHAKGPVAAVPPPEVKAVREVIREFAAFGVALPLGYLVSWVLSTSDRYLVAHFMTTEDVGIYAMNYGFWSLPYLMLNAWLEILTRPRIYQKASKGDWRGMRYILAGRIGLAFGLGLVGSVLLMLIGEDLSISILGQKYQTDWGVPTCIGIAHLCLIVGYAASPAFLATKKMNVILYSTLTAAITNLVLNLLLIPQLGLLGAALSTLAAYFLWATIVVILAVGYTSRLCAMSVLK